MKPGDHVLLGSFHFAATCIQQWTKDFGVAHARSQAAWMIRMSYGDPIGPWIRMAFLSAWG